MKHHNLKKPIPLPPQPEGKPFKSLILIISTHGQIPFQKNDNDNTLTSVKTVIPEGLEVIKYSMALCGVASMCSDISINEHVTLINNNADTLLDQYTSDSYFNEFGNKIKEVSDEYSYSRKKRKIYSSEDVFMTDYRCRYEQGFNVFFLKPNDEIIDKRFLRKQKEKNNNDFSILLLRKKLIVDENRVPILYDILPDNDEPDETQEIYLHALLNKAASSGVTRLIIFDFSCSAFGTPELDLNPRETRQFRNNLISEGVKYGGFHKKCKTKKRNKRIKNVHKKRKQKCNKNKTAKHKNKW